MQFSYASKKLEGSGITQSHYGGKHDVTSGKLAQHLASLKSFTIMLLGIYSELKRYKTSRKNRSLSNSF